MLAVNIFAQISSLWLIAAAFANMLASQQCGGDARDCLINVVFIIYVCQINVFLKTSDNGSMIHLSMHQRYYNITLATSLLIDTS